MESFSKLKKLRTNNVAKSSKVHSNENVQLSSMYILMIEKQKYESLGVKEFNFLKESFKMKLISSVYSVARCVKTNWYEYQFNLIQLELIFSKYRFVTELLNKVEKLEILLTPEGYF